MEEIIVQGGNRLEGVVKVEGAKNAVLPILAAAILAETGKVHLACCAWSMAGRKLSIIRV